MKELTEEQVRVMRARNARKGKVESPPTLTEEDQRILDEVWQEVGKDRNSTKAPARQSE